MDYSMIDANGPVAERDEVACAVCLKMVSRQGLPQHMLAKHADLRSATPPSRPEDAPEGEAK